MSSFLNRLKNLKPGANPNNEGDTNSICSFDEEGFLCPICHRKFIDTTSLEHHYSQTHNRYDSSSSASEDSSIWKEQFLSSEQSRMALTSELMEHKQRIGDLEEEFESLSKKFRLAQTKIIDQSKEIGNLKATNDAYKSQLAVFSTELLSTKDELKEKENQVETLCNDLLPSLPTDDDVLVLKQELIAVQQRMNEFAMEKEKEIDDYQEILRQQNSFIDRFFTSNFDIENEIETIDSSIKFVREEKQTIEKKIQHLKNQFDDLKRSKIDLVKQIEDLREEKTRFLQMKINDDENEERQNLFRFVTEEKDQIERENKELRRQMEQIQIESKLRDDEIDKFRNQIERLRKGIRHSIESTRKTRQFLDENLSSRQTTFVELIDECENLRSESKRFVNSFENQIERLIESTRRIQKFLVENISSSQTAFVESIDDLSFESKKLFEIVENHRKEIYEIVENLFQTKNKCEIQREKIKNLQDDLNANRIDLENRTKKFEMQINALKENLGTVRGDLRSAQEKFEQIKNEKIDLEKRLAECDDERRNLAERSITNENKISKLLKENGELTKKNSDVESALQEIAREYQSLQIQTNTNSQRRWVNDQEVHQCTKCEQTFSLTQRKHHCRSCGNVFCERCSSKTAIIAATSKKPQRVCDQCYKELTS